MKPYPFDNMREIAAMNIINRKRRYLELEMIVCISQGNALEYRLIVIQCILNELPIYMTPTETIAYRRYIRLNRCAV